MQKQPSRKKAVMTQLVGGYLNTAISITQGLLLLPIYFKFIDFVTYGYWITITSIIAMLEIINFGIGNMVTQRISSSYAKRNFQFVADYFINSQFLYFLISIAILIVGYLLSFWIQDILNLQKSQADLLITAYYIALITASLSVFSGSLKGFSQAMLKPLFGVYSTILSRIIGILLVVVMLYEEIGLLSIPISLLVTEILIFVSNSIYVLIQYKKLNITSKLQKNILYEYLYLSPHLFGLMVGNTLSNKTHPLIITTFLGAEMTTAYTVTRKAVEIVQQVLNVFNSSLIGPFSHLVGEGNTEKIKQISIKILSLSFVISLITFGAYIATNHMFVTLWIDKNIVLTQDVIFAIGIGAIFFTMARLMRSQLFGLNEFKFTSNMTLVEGIIFIILSLFLVQILGVIGIAFSMLVSSAIVTVSFFIKLTNLLEIESSKFTIAKMILTILIICSYLVYSTTNNSTVSWLYFLYSILEAILGIAIISLSINYRYAISIIKRKKTDGYTSQI